MLLMVITLPTISKSLFRYVSANTKTRKNMDYVRMFRIIKCILLNGVGGL
jgi:hypothetical protein